MNKSGFRKLLKKFFFTYFFTGIVLSCLLEILMFFLNNPRHYSVSCGFLIAFSIYGIIFASTLVTHFGHFINAGGKIADPIETKAHFFKSGIFIQTGKFLLVTCFFYLIVSSYQEILLPAISGLVCGLFSGAIILSKFQPKIKKILS